MLNYYLLKCHARFDHTIPQVPPGIHPVAVKSIIYFANSTLWMLFVSVTAAIIQLLLNSK